MPASLSPKSSNDAISIIAIDNRSPEFKQAERIRRNVFINEQNVAEEEEWDALDQSATHLLMMIDGDAVATLRYYEDSGWLHIGRIAVLKHCRGMGLGRLIVLQALANGRGLGLSRAFLNAQSDKVDFYRKFGFQAVGDEFMEAGIPHYRMELEKAVDQQEDHGKSI